MQLVAYGAQDVYLTGNPQITFWKVTYRRHTNFATESIEQTFNGQADFGRRVTCTLARNGDLAYRTYFQVTLPQIGGWGDVGSSYNGGTPSTSGLQACYARWLDYPGEQMIAQVEVEIGGQRIDRQYGDWMHIWNQLTLSSEQKRGYQRMVGETTQLTYLCDPAFADVEGPCDSDAPTQVCAPRNALPETTLYVPLQFWYCRNPGLALPLIALQYHEVRINLDIRPIDECLWAVNTLACGLANFGNYSDGGAYSSTDASMQGSGTPTFPVKGNFTATSSGTQANIKNTTAYQQSLVAASLYVDYVFLDTDERRRMAQNPHEYLIEQLQFTGDESVGSSSNKIKLNFNHPCKELIWVVQPDSNVDYCSSLTCGTSLYAALGAQPFNYTDAIDALPNAIHAFAGPGTVGYNDFIDPSGPYTSDGTPLGTGILQAPGSHSHGMGDGSSTNSTQNHIQDLNYSTTHTSQWQEVDGNHEGKSAIHNNPTLGSAQDLADGHFNGRGPFGTHNSGAHGPGSYNQSMVSDAGAFVLAETALNLHCWGENPVVTGKLQLNGQDRFSEREGTYFDLVQPYQHHTRNPDTGINVYSFALRPEEHQPSGSCNFSRIDNATLQLVLSNATVEGTKTAKVRVYATNYNVLRVMSGMGGLAYSN